LGGVFFVKQMEHMLVALIIYGILMTGVLMQRAATYGPGIMAAGALVYAFYSNACFHDKFNKANRKRKRKKKNRQWKKKE